MELLTQQRQGSCTLVKHSKVIDLKNLKERSVYMEEKSLFESLDIHFSFLIPSLFSLPIILRPNFLEMIHWLQCMLLSWVSEWGQKRKEVKKALSWMNPLQGMELLWFEFLFIQNNFAKNKLLTYLIQFLTFA